MLKDIKDRINISGWKNTHTKGFLEYKLYTFNRIKQTIYIFFIYNLNIPILNIYKS